MLKPQDKNKQADELMKQNETLMNALQNANQLLEQLSKQPQQSDQQQNVQSQQNQQQQSNPYTQQQNSNPNQQQALDCSNPNQQQNQQGQQAGELANELLKIKELVTTLEAKTENYVVNSSSKALNEKDVASLVLILIDGMIDWATEFINQKNGSSNS